MAQGLPTWGSKQPRNRGPLSASSGAPTVLHPPGQQLHVASPRLPSDAPAAAAASCCGRVPTASQDAPTPPPFTTLPTASAAEPPRSASAPEGRAVAALSPSSTAAAVSRGAASPEPVSAPLSDVAQQPIESENESDEGEISCLLLTGGENLMTSHT